MDVHRYPAPNQDGAGVPRRQTQSDEHWALLRSWHNATSEDRYQLTSDGFKGYNYAVGTLDNRAD
jgi:hypothetical protein